MFTEAATKCTTLIRDFTSAIGADITVSILNRPTPTTNVKDEQSETQHIQYRNNLSEYMYMHISHTI